MTKLQLIEKGDTHVTFQRRFAAPPQEVFEAHTQAGIMQKWLLGPDGWSMPICVSELEEDGLIHCVWAKPDGGGCFSLTGRYLELEAPHRIVHVERMHMPEMNTPENRVETRFAADGDGTMMTLRMQVPSPEALEGMLSSGMEQGMEASYARLDNTWASSA